MNFNNRVQYQAPALVGLIMDTNTDSQMELFLEHIYFPEAYYRFDQKLRM
jgi:hypothetical protein